MNLQDLQYRLAEAKEPYGSFDDAVSEVKPLAEIITEEHFDTATVLEAVRKYANKKVTSQLLEQYHEAASSKEFTSDPITLSILDKSQYKFDGKYLFVIEGRVVALSEEAIGLLEDTEVSLENFKRTLIERQ